MTTSTAPATSADLAIRYERGDFLLATARHALLTSGTAATATDTEPERLSRALPALFADTGAPVAVGVLPFDTSEGTSTPGHLVLPTSAHRASADQASLPMREDLPHPVKVTSVPEPEAHLAAVRAAIASLGDRDLRKAVLARALDLDFDEPIQVAHIVRNLLRGNPRHFTYAAQLPDGRTLVGATPELLLSRAGGSVVSHPHAGSMPRSADPVIDKAKGEALLASEKDHVEHAVVVESVVETLRPFCRTLDVRGPELVSTPAIWHLSTTVTGELIDQDITALDLAAALHPTPAICGTPTDAARSLVTELEPFDRAYYAGAVGWVDTAGDGEWAVGIRCAEIADTSMRLYAGGGIVPASDPWTELGETSVKFRTLLSAMGLDLTI